MKKIILLLVVIISVSTSFAQEYRVETVTKYDSVTVNARQRYYAPFWHNMYLQAAFAGRVLMAEEDSRMSFGERVKPGFMVAVGSDITPLFGVRLSGGGVRLDGWNSGERGIYKVNGTWLPTNTDPVEEYLISKGVNTENGYKQQLRYYEISADFTLDLLNAFSRNYNFQRKFDATAYMGMGLVHMTKSHGSAGNTKAALRLGAIFSYKVSPRMSVNAELLYAVTDATFDGEIGKGNRFDKYSAGMIGFSYRIGKQGYKVRRSISAEQYALLSALVNKIQKEVKNGESRVIVEKVVIKEPETDLLSPTVVFDMGDLSFNEELQKVNIFQIADYMKQNPDLRIAIIGNLATTERMLARRRAEKIKSILVEEYLIDGNRLDVLVEDFKKTISSDKQNQSVLFKIAGNKNSK